MNITLIDKFNLVFSVYKILHRLPSIKETMVLLFNPIDSVRFVEFAYVLKSMKKYKIRPDHILDISSPYALAYILSGISKVIKTDINIDEKKHIKNSEILSFKCENARNLSFNNDCFDFVYSISVIEHIYDGYMDALNEMLRVLKPGGYLYVTFPVSCNHVEEWVSDDIYSSQYRLDGKIFFQYRFDNSDYQTILQGLSDIEIVDHSIYWESSEGQYDRAMNNLRLDCKLKWLNLLKKSFLEAWYGLVLLENSPKDFLKAKSFGNASILLKKMK